jgi:hypothetical protein
VDQKTIGAWVVHHTNKLEQSVGPHSYDSILTAGKAGILLSALSATNLNRLSRPKVDALARAANINRLELPALLQMLSDKGLIRADDTTIDILGVTTPTVLQRTSEIFNELGPTSLENASIGLAELSSTAPVEEKEAAEWASDTFKLGRAETVELFESAQQIGFVDYESLDDTHKLYFNGNLFRRGNAEKVVRVLATLNDSERRTVSEVEEILKKRGCITQGEIEKILGKSLLSKLNAISMYDISTVRNEKEEVGYVTRPAAFNKYGDGMADDALDLAKALVSSLTYGMTRRPSSEGRVDYVRALLAKLIRGEWVGSATAIGQDYRALEFRGVVEIRAGFRGYGFDMRLRKREIGEMALAVIASGDVSEASLPNFGGIAVKSFTGPETNRSNRRQRQRIESKKATANIIIALRTGGISR